jgi:hypothetical protein
MKRECAATSRPNWRRWLPKACACMRRFAGEKAKALVDQALALQQTIASEAAEKGRHTSQRLAVDLAHACFATGKEDRPTGSCARWRPRTTKTPT